MNGREIHKAPADSAKHPAGHPSQLEQLDDNTDLDNTENLHLHSQEEDRIVHFDYKE